MAKYKEVIVKRKRAQFFVLVVVILLILLAAYVLGHFIYSHYSALGGLNGENAYLIKNNSYGFEIKAPKNWIVQENTSYTQDGVAQLLDDCQNNKIDGTSAYEIGAFRLKDRAFLQNPGDATGSYPSGAILSISINCVPGNSKNRILDYDYGNLLIGGERALSGVLNFLGFGKTEFLYFFHNGLQYRLSEYIYISPADKGKNEAGLRKNYASIFDGIISSFKFTK